MAPPRNRRRGKGKPRPGNINKGSISGPGGADSGATVMELREIRKKRLSEREATPKDMALRAFEEKNYVKAAEAYSSALLSNKKDKTLYANRSAVYIAMKKFGLAFNDAKSALQLDPKWPKAYFRLGHAAEKLANQEEALSYYKTGLKLAEDSHSQLTLAKGNTQPNQTHDFKILREAVKRVQCTCQVLDIKSRIETDPQDPLYGMILWLRKGGAAFRTLYIKRYRDQHRGVHVLKSIAPETEILHIPLKFIMTSEMARASSICKSMLSKKVEVESAHTWIATFLLQERHKKKSSFFYPYINALPKKFPTIPLFFKENLLKELKGSFSLGKISRRNEHLNHEYIRLQHKLEEFKHFSYEDFVWARLVVITRIFGIVVNGVKTDGLVPYADMLNHKVPRETNWTYSDAKEGFNITTIRGLKMGAEVFDSYGHKCNHRFFVNYGFTIRNNHDDNECVISIDLEQLHIQEAKLKALKSLYLDPSLHNTHQIPAKYDSKSKRLFGFCRLMVAGVADFNNVVYQIAGSHRMQIGRGEVPDFHLEAIEAISRENEIKVLTNIRSAARSALAEFDTSVAYDRKLLDDGIKDINLKNCVVMRLGEKLVLEWWVSLCDRGLDMLNMSFFRLRGRIKAILNEDPDFDAYVEQVLEPLVRRDAYF